MIGILVTAMFAIGCFLFTISLAVRSSGDPLRRVALALIAIPLAAVIFFGSFIEAIRQNGVQVSTFDTMVTFGIISVIAYVILAVRRRLTARAEKKPFRIREKRPIDRRRNDFISYIREQLEDHDE